MHRFLPFAAGLVAGALVGQGAPRTAFADPSGAEILRRASVVAVVGVAPASRAISVADLEDQIASMPGFERTTFGPTAEAIRRSVLDAFFVRDALFSLAAEGAGLDAQPSVVHAIERARSSATIRAIRDGLGPAADVPMADVRAYYERNRARYDAPARYQIWRILCKTREDAQGVLDAALADGTPKTFAQLARDHSLDKATALRAGNLGFLTVDGESTEPGLRVEPAVVRAAQTVRDGDLVRVPVTEGQFTSVVWRRGTIPAQRRPVDDVAPQIREILRREQVKQETDKRVATLRAARVSDVHEELLDGVDLSTEPDARAP